MTIEQVIQVVEDRTGEKVTADTDLKDVGLDSLEFLDLLLAVGVSQASSQDINTVNDLYLAAQ